MGFKESISPRLIANRYRLLRSYQKKEKISRGFPVELALELTNHCNADCIMCPRQKMKRPKGFMPFDIFKKIVDEAREYTEFIFLHLAGEPLMNPDLFKMIEYCGQIGMKCGLSTNAICLDKKRAGQLVDSALDVLVLSFDGVTKETYEKIRRKANFEKTLENIEYFLELKAAHKKSKNNKNKSPYTMIQLIYQKENFSEAREFYFKWKKSAVDIVRVKPYLNYPGLDEFQGKIPLRTDAQNIGNPGETANPANPTSQNEQTKETKQKRKKKVQPCVLLWRQLAIYWDGTVVGCCMDFLSRGVIGDVSKESLADIWNGEKMQQLRKQHAEGNQNNMHLCKECTQPQVGGVMLLGTLFLDDLVIKKLLPRIEQWSILRNMKKVSYFE